MSQPMLSLLKLKSFETMSHLFFLLTTQSIPFVTQHLLTHLELAYCQYFSNTIHFNVGSFQEDRALPACILKPDVLFIWDGLLKLS